MARITKRTVVLLVLIALGANLAGCRREPAANDQAQGTGTETRQTTPEPQGVPEPQTGPEEDTPEPQETPEPQPQEPQDEPTEPESETDFESGAMEPDSEYGWEDEPNVPETQYDEWETTEEEMWDE